MIFGHAVLIQFTSLIPRCNSKSLIYSKIQYFKNNLNGRLFTARLPLKRNVIILNYLLSVTPDDIISFRCGTIFSSLHRRLTLLAKIIDMHVYSNLL